MTFKETIKDHKLEKPIITNLQIGDYSKDGHGESDTFQLMVNYPVSDIRQAYKESCRTTGIQFHDGTDYTGSNQSYIDDQILTDYDNNYIRPYEVKLLHRHNILTDQFIKEHELEFEENKGFCMTYDAKTVADLIMEFIAHSMPDDFAYFHTNQTCESINGYRKNELRHQFGYGIYN